MADSCIETNEAPEWLQKLESQREKLSKGKLGHDSGAGAPCITCGPKCPGLDLHFWRKVCRSCHCSKDVHDVPDDELSGWAQFQLLGTKRPNKSHLPVIKIRGITEEAVKLDWAPPNTSTELVSDYMSCLGSELAPVAGTPAAKRWRAQLRTQLPHHDVTPRENGTNEETIEHKEYISKIKDEMVGVGNVIRVGQVKSPSIYTIEEPKSHQTTPNKSYALHLKLSNITKGVKYMVTPKNTTDKKLILDNEGNIVSSAASLPDYKNTPILTMPVKDKLRDMNIESDRIKSAVEHGPIYDKLFQSLDKIKYPIECDVYLKPIYEFRVAYLKDPSFRDEVNVFAKKSLGANILDDNYPYSDARGTIFAPNGEVWGWKCDRSELPDDGADKFEDLHAPPLPNYGTYPGQLRPQEQYGATSPRNIERGLNKYNEGYTSPAEIHHPEPYKDTRTSKSKTSHFKAPSGDYNHCRPIEVQATPPPNAIVPIPQYATPASTVGTILDNVSALSLSASSAVSECKRCTKAIFSGEVAVEITRAGEVLHWHPTCFTCAKCQQLLADLLYFYHEGDVYCARDVAQVMGVPRCDGCDHLIFTTYTAAEGKNYHVNHFCCYYCDLPLGGNKYVAAGEGGTTGHPICLSCYEKEEAAICSSCQKTIAASEQGVSWSDIHWHAKCFNCAGVNCTMALLGHPFTVRMGKPFCSVDCVKSVLG